MGGHEKIVELLLSKGVEVDARWKLQQCAASGIT